MFYFIFLLVGYNQALGGTAVLPSTNLALKGYIFGSSVFWSTCWSTRCIIINKALKTHAYPNNKCLLKLMKRWGQPVADTNKPLSGSDVLALKSDPLPPFSALIPSGNLRALSPFK